jgi:hypothetical protein
MDLDKLELEIKNINAKIDHLLLQSSSKTNELEFNILSSILTKLVAKRDSEK